MHFTTSCPACGTIFRVVPDQLKISDGWVRCGHCADVFDARLYLETWKSAAAPSAGHSANPKGPSVSPRSAPPLAFKAVSEAIVNKPLASPQEAPRASVQTEAQHAPTDGAGLVANLAKVPPSLAPVRAESVESSNPVPQHSAGQGLAGPEPGFVRKARRRAFWNSPGVRSLLSVFVLLLTMGLGLQFALHERDALAAWQPRWTPVLHQLCVPLGCEVTAVKKIDAVVIDSATLVHRLGHFYSFDLVLQNTATVALAMPALELSLTDTRDVVIARRVFLPEEMPGAPTLLPAKNSVTISLRLSLTVGESMPMAGYRALVFYP